MKKLILIEEITKMRSMMGLNETQLDMFTGTEDEAPAEDSHIGKRVMVYYNLHKHTFSIQFKKEAAVNPDELKAAVEDAGFFVGGLELEGTWPLDQPNLSSPLQLGGNWYQVLSGKANKGKPSFTISVIDKGFVTSKEFKKNAKYTQMECYKTGFMGSCCKQKVKSDGVRIYHVTI